MVARPAGENRPQVQSLKLVGKEVRCNKPEYPLCQIMIVAQAAGLGVGGSGGHSAGRVVLSIHSVGIKAKLVVQSLASAEKSQRKIRGLAVSAGKSKAHIQSRLPTLHPSGMQGLVVRGLLRLIAQSLDLHN